MAVITPQGIVGKIAKAFPGTSQVLEINDVTAGAGVMLERSRLRGVLRGTVSGIPEILHIMADEKVDHGEPVVSSGGDQIYPRGLPIGTVFNTEPDPEGGPFMVVKVKPSANLDKVEEVLVITKVIDKSPEHQETVKGLRAADILAQRLPTIVPKPPEKANEEPPSTAVLYGHAAAKSPGAAGAASTVTQKSPGTTQPKTAGSDDGNSAAISSAPKRKVIPEPSGAGSETKPAGIENSPAAAVQPDKPKPPKPASPTSDSAPPQEIPR
jgi:rod shape-determining protein MreC